MVTKTSSARRLFRVALLIGSALGAQPAFAQQPPSPEITGIEDIIVTAQKREQNLQDVPISITALSANTLQTNRIQDVRDLNALAPNLSIRLSTGGAQIPTITLRGLLTGGTAVGTDKGVALYLDGVYVQNVAGSVFDFADIERIEVLKGPQGTLFGRNSTAGAISITTRNPTGEFSARQEFTYGNYDQLRSKTRVDLPQVGPFSATVTYLHSERRGDIRNLGAGTVTDYGPATNGRLGKTVSPKTLGADNVEAVSTAIKADFFDDLDLMYKFDYSENNYSPTGQGLTYLPTGGLIRALYDFSPGPKTPVQRNRPDAVNNALTAPSRLYSLGHNLTATYHLNDQITLKNILAQRKSRVSTASQFDGLGHLRNLPLVPTPVGALPVGLALTPAVTGNATLASANTAAPFSILTVHVDSRERQWSDEFQVNVDTDWFSLTAGYIYFTNKIKADGGDGLFNSLIFTAIAGQNTPSAGTAGVTPGNRGFINSQVRSTSNAWYVQPEFHLTPTIDLVAGARITKDRKRGFQTAPDQALATAAAGRPAPITVPVRYRDSEASFSVGVNWKPSQHVLVYAKYADGYISGGQLATITFVPEKAFSYEGGVKADLFDRRLRSNLAIYHVDYKSLQFTTSGLLTGVPSSAPFAQAVVSSGNARARGFEWENTLVPVDGVTLGVNAGYTDFKFDDATIFPGFLLQAGAPGYQEFARPKWTLNLSAQYESPEFFRGGHLLARVDGNFRSSQLMTSDVAPGNGPTAQEDPALRRAATVPASWVVNGRIGISSMDIGFTKADVALWGRNIFDNDRMAQFTAIDFGALGSFGSALYERARTYGVDVIFAF